VVRVVLLILFIAIATLVFVGLRNLPDEVNALFG
jgi:hypothetical protein